MYAFSLCTTFCFYIFLPTQPGLVPGLFFYKTGDKMEEKFLPQDIAAEKAVLAAILLDRDSIKKILDVLDADDFSREAHKVIYKAMMSLFFHDEPIDYITLTNYLRSRNELASVGGLAYVMGLNAISAANITYHAAIVKDKSVLRSMIRAGMIIQELGYSASDVNKAVDKAQHLVMQLSNFHHKETLQTDSLSELLKYCLNRVISSNYKGIYTGFKCLDNMTNGLHPGTLTIIYGVSGCGKTALVLQIMANMMKNNKVIYITDSGLDEIALRMICVLAEVSCWRFKTNQMSDDDWEKIQQAIISNETDRVGIYSFDASLIELISRIREIYREKKMDVLILDLQCIRQTDEELLKKVKSLADELGIVIIVNMKKIPEQIQVDDLRLLLKKDNNSDYKLSIEKHIGGPVGSIDMSFDSTVLTFKEM